jgi:hypothetical protein
MLMKTDIPTQQSPRAYDSPLSVGKQMAETVVE